MKAMLGANDTYDVARFRVDGQKTSPLTIAGGLAAEGEQVWLLPYREVKNLPNGTVTKAETFSGEYGYYTLSLTMPSSLPSEGLGDGGKISPPSEGLGEASVGAPLMNGEGLVVGLMQQPYATDGTVSYAVSARFADSLRITGLSINDPVLKSTNIKKALPDDEEQALLTVYLAGMQTDSAAYIALLDEFISQFPQSQDGYLNRAQAEAASQQYEQADRDIATALKVADKPDEVHYGYSRLIYQVNMLAQEPQIVNGKPVDRELPWTLDKALEEAKKAYDINPLPSYLHQQAVTLMAMKRYDEAYADYEQLSSGPLRSADLFYEAARCKQLQNDTVAQMALLDSCVATFSKPYLKEAAPYLVAVAQAKMEAGKNRDAVTLLNDYEKLMQADLNDRFYYLRFEAEVAGRLFQQALNDITQAIQMNPTTDLYYAEKASLQVRVGLYDDAIATAKACIEVAPDHSDG